MRYLDSVHVVLAKPNWLTNCLSLGVCQLIPVVGPLVGIGYQYEVSEAVFRSPGKPIPDFVWNRFADYLVRGLWPFLVQLILGVVMMPVIMAVAFAFAIGTAATAQPGAGEMVVVRAVLFLAAFAAVAVLVVAVNVLALPMHLRAGLAQEIGPAFDFRAAFDFVGRMWVEMLLTILFMVVGGMVAFFIGIAMFCVGHILVTFPILMTALGILHGRMYDLYLQRGGIPVQLKEPKMAYVAL